MKYLLVFFLSANIIYPQSFTISGIVLDSENKEGLQSANLFIKELNSGTSTDNFGKFSLENVPIGNYTLAVSYLGYSSEEVNIELSKNLQITIN